MIRLETTTTKAPTKEMGNLWSLRGLEGFGISATDGDIGKVHDFFFDDQSWHVRYLVADTRHWLPGWKVLLPTPMLIGPHPQERTFAVSITREKVKTSPDVDTEQPVSRIRERELHVHYDWPFHWGMVGAWVGSVPPVPPIEPPPPLTMDGQENSHLRSVREMTGYHADAMDGAAGVVEDFIADDKSWIVRFLVINTTKLASHRKVAIFPDNLAGPISWLKHTVTLKLSLEEINKLPDWKPAQG